VTSDFVYCPGSMRDFGVAEALDRSDHAAS